jgi:hypothetical protein
LSLRPSLPGVAGRTRTYVPNIWDRQAASEVDAVIDYL